MLSTDTKGLGLCVGSIIAIALALFVVFLACKGFLIVAQFIINYKF